MRKTTFTTPTLEFYFNVFGFKRSKVVDVTESVFEPETFQESLDLTCMYHTARKNFLIALRKLDGAITDLGHRIDLENKESLKQKLKARRLIELIIDKEPLSKLMTRVDELLNVINSDEVPTSMSEWDYTVLCNFEHFIEYVITEFARIKESVESRHK